MKSKSRQRDAAIQVIYIVNFQVEAAKVQFISI